MTSTSPSDDPGLTSEAIEAEEKRRRLGYEKAIRQTPDPTAPSNDKVRLHCDRVMKWFDPDERGLVEVLYVLANGTAMTAFFRGQAVAYVSEGW